MKPTLLLIFTVVLTLLIVVCGGNDLKAPDISILDAISEGNVLVVKQHMEAGTNPDKSFVPTGYPLAGASALHLAVFSNNKEIVQLLLDNGADKNIKANDQPGGTPLQWAAFWGIRGMTEFMVNAGAEINAKDNNGCTPLCASNLHNPYIKEKDMETFRKNRPAIQAFLKSKGGIDLNDFRLR